MSNQLQITGGAKVRALEGVITGTSGVLGSVPLGAANGVATLDSGGKVPVSQLPSSVVTYLGTWNAATNTPTLTNGVGDAGDMYICNVAGTVNFGAGPVVFAVGDWVLYGSGTWQKSNGQNGTVTSVAATITGGAIGITGSPITTAGTLAFTFAGTSGQYVNGAGNLTTFPTLITSIGLSMPSAFSVANSPLTANGSINVTGAGTTLQFIDGTGALQTFPSLTGFIPYTGATTAIDLNAKTVVNISHLGINTTTVPTILIRAVGDNNSSSRIAMRGYSSDANSSSIRVTKFRGTVGAPQAPQSGDSLGKFELAGYGTTSSEGYPQASFEGLATESWGAIARGTKVVIKVTPNTTITQAVALTINQDKSAVFENSITGTSLIKTGGTSSQFLKADGSVDSSSYITLASLSAGVGISYNNTTGVITSTITQYTDALARAAISLTTTGTSGAATYNSTTGVLNVPNYAPDLSGYVTLATNQTISGVKTFSANTSINTSGQSSLSILSSTGNSALILSYINGVLKGTIDISATEFKFVSGINSTFKFQASGLGLASLIFNNTTNYSYTYPSATGTLALTSDLTGGTVTSVGLSAPTGFSVSGSPVTSSGTLALAFATGYSLPTTASQTTWDTAYTNRITSATAPLSISSNVISISQSTTSTSGYLSSTDWNTFNNKQSALTNPVTGTGTTNYLPKFTGASTIGNSIVTDDGTLVSITTSTAKLIGGDSVGRLVLANSTQTTYGIFYGATNATPNITTFVNNSALTLTLNANNSATFSGAVTVGDNLSMNAGGQFYYGDPSTNRYLRTYVSGASGSATLNYSFWNGSAWAIKSTLDYNGAATFSSSVTAGALSRIGDVYIGGRSGTYATYSDGIIGDNLHLAASGTGGAVYINTALSRNTYINPVGGNVGIGTTSPGNLLEVQGSAKLNAPTSGTVNLAFGISGTNYASIKYNDSDGSLTTQTLGSYPLIFGTNITERMRITSGGNVGIGTISPTIVSGFTDLTIDGSSGSFIDLRYNGADNGRFVSSAGIVGLQSLSTTPLTFNTNGSERMRITSGGSVNINNTTNTTYKLSVYNTVQDTHLLVAGTAPSLRFADTLTGITYTSVLGMATAANNFITGSAAGDFAITWNSAKNCYFGFTDTSTAKMTIDSSGNLGVGTTTMGSKTQINGNLSVGYSASTAAPTNGILSNGGFKSSNPTGGTAQTWKLGSAYAGTITSNYYVNVEINGVIYALLASNAV